VVRTNRDTPENQPAEAQVGWVKFFQRRIMAGLFATLPLFVTLWIIQFTYNLLIHSILNPTRQLILHLFGLKPAENTPWWWQMVVAPGLVMILLALCLFLVGGLARSRIYRMVDWIFRRLPVVKTVYDAVSNLMQSLDQSKSSKFEKVVLFDFPNSRVKSLGFVTNTLVEEGSQKKIYAVMLLTGVMPPTGFTLFVPADDVVELDWTPTQAIQAIVSGGISAPGQLSFGD
jgi:uncharacterized membrane protein